MKRGRVMDMHTACCQNSWDNKSNIIRWLWCAIQIFECASCTRGKQGNSNLFVTISMCWCMNSAPLLRRPEGLLTLLLSVDSWWEHRYEIGRNLFFSAQNVRDEPCLAPHLLPTSFFFLPTPQTLTSFCALLYRSSCLYPPTSYLSFCSYFVQSYPSPHRLIHFILCLPETLRSPSSPLFPPFDFCFALASVCRATYCPFKCMCVWVWIGD